MAKRKLTNCIDDYIDFLNKQEFDNPFEEAKPLYEIYCLKKTRGFYPNYRLQKKEVQKAILEYCKFLSVCWDANVYYSSQDKTDALFDNLTNHIQNNIQSVNNLFSKRVTLVRSSYDTDVFMYTVLNNEKEVLNTIIYKYTDAFIYSYVLLSEVLSTLFAKMDDSIKLALMV